MNREEKWLGQQIALLKSHLKALKALSTDERQARQGLKSKHKQQRDRLLARKSNAVNLTMALLQTKQAEALTQLISVYSLERLHLLADQWEEYTELTKLIEIERLAVRNQPV